MGPLKPRSALVKLLKQRRIELGFTQTALAKRIGCTNGLICHWEAYRRSVPVNLRGLLAKILEIDPRVIQGLILADWQIELERRLKKPMRKPKIED